MSGNFTVWFYPRCGMTNSSRFRSTSSVASKMMRALIALLTTDGVITTH